MQNRFLIFQESVAVSTLFQYPVNGSPQGIGMLYATVWCDHLIGMLYATVCCEHLFGMLYATVCCEHLFGMLYATVCCEHLIDTVVHLLIVYWYFFYNEIISI